MIFFVLLLLATTTCKKIVVTQTNCGRGPKVPGKDLALIHSHIPNSSQNYQLSFTHSDAFKNEITPDFHTRCNYIDVSRQAFDIWGCKNSTAWGTHVRCGDTKEWGPGSLHRVSHFTESRPYGAALL
jgi:hypothetical protein